MAFDGSIVYALAKELDAQLKDGRISRIIQPEKDELLLTVKQGGCQKRVLLSVNPSLPMVYLTDQTKNAPITAPTFCMLLRKHLTGGRILSVTQPSMERIIDFEIEHYNEMGDLCRKTLTIELMNKYSNIILRQDNQILDSIKHISSLVSSVREVLPGREYFIPFSNDKINPFRTDCKEFSDRVYSVGSLSAAKAIYSHVTGFSPMLAEEVLYRSGIDSDRSAASLLPEEQRTVYAAFQEVMRQIACASVTVSSGTSDTASFDCVESPKEVKSQNCRKAQEASRVNIIYQGEEPAAYGTFHYRLYEDPSFRIVEYDSISRLLSDFYSKKQALTSMRQKTAALRQTVHTLLNKNNKKYDLQQKQLKDTEKKEKYRVYGELLTAYGYSAQPGLSVFETTDFYTGEAVSIPLDPSLSAVENGKNYFKKYAKLKRTADALNDILKKTREEIDHLESILVSLDLVQEPADIAQIRQELKEAGYIKTGMLKDKTGKGNRKPEKTEPLHYISTDGFHMYVGKNNFQNDQLTFQTASANDWWFHAKDIPGSHVIVKAEGCELPDRTFEEAASLAAHYSKSEGSKKVEVQYTQRKNLKKPPAARPGFVVFHTYYSMAADTCIDHIPTA